MKSKSSHSPAPAPIVILHGLDGSSEGHWQSWLADQLGHSGYDVHFPDLPEKEHPSLLDWTDEIHALLRQTGPHTTLVAHSLSAYLWLHYASLSGASRVQRVLLVAPPGDEEIRHTRRIRHTFQLPLSETRIHQAADELLMVGSEADPYCARGFLDTYARPLRLSYLQLGNEAGHINPESGFGPWPFALRWTLRHARRAAAPSHTIDRMTLSLANYLD